MGFVVQAERDASRRPRSGRVAQKRKSGIRPALWRRRRPTRAAAAGPPPAFGWSASWVATLEDILLPAADGFARGGARRTAARYEKALRGSQRPKTPRSSRRSPATGIAAPGRPHWTIGRRTTKADKSGFSKSPAGGRGPGRPAVRDAKLWEDKAALEEFANRRPSRTSPSLLKFLDSQLSRTTPSIPQTVSSLTPTVFGERRARNRCSKGNPAESMRTLPGLRSPFNKPGRLALQSSARWATSKVGRSSGAQGGESLARIRRLQHSIGRA